MTLPVPLGYYMVLAAILFALGVVGVLRSRNSLVILMGIELMLNAANLLLVVFSKLHGDVAGHVMVFMILTVAAAEAAVGLSLVVAIFRRKGSVNIDSLNLMKG